MDLFGIYMAPSKKDKSVAIVGVRGFKGHHVLKALEENSQFKKVIAIDYKKPKIHLVKTKFYQVNLTETLADVALTKILKNENCDTVIHTAMPVTPLHDENLAHEVIAIGTYYILNACHAASVRKIVMASTADVYGAFPTNPNFLTEDMTPRGYRHSKFLRDKIDAENQLMSYQKKHPKSVVTIVRPTTILGPNIHSYKIDYLNRPVVPTIMGFDPLMQFVHEKDVLNLLIKLVSEDHPGIFNLAGDGVLPLSKAIRLCGKLNMRLDSFTFKTLGQLLWYADLAVAPASHIDFLRYLCIVDNQKIKTEIGFVPEYTSKEALQSFVETNRPGLKELLEV